MIDPTMTVSDAAAAVAAAAAIAIWRHAKAIHAQIDTNTTTLFGLEDSDAQEGLVSKVVRHERVLKRENLLQSEDIHD